mgnify:CR=1 FL=1
MDYALFPFFRGRAFFVASVLLTQRIKDIGRYAMNEVKTSENRIAVVSILVSDRSASEHINTILSEFGDWIIGRMGIPYKEKGVSILSVVMDAPVEKVNTLTGKIGKMKGVSVKALFGKM